MKNCLLIIDAQNDFCDPAGSLYVNGAQEDCRRLADFVDQNNDSLDEIFLTMDNHHLYDIAHPVYWIDDKGDHPHPFTIITVEDVESGRWKTSREDERGHGLNYVKALAAKGRYSLCIWPPHCLIGSWGAQIVKPVLDSLYKWESRRFKASEKTFKGMSPKTEHYGALEAEVPFSGDGSTLMNRELAERLNGSDRIFIAGEALDYCVANTVLQLSAFIDPGKILLLEDCCSSVNPTSGLSADFLRKMKSKGMNTGKSSLVL